MIEPGQSYGFFTDTTLCIGCKACEVACKEWNRLPADPAAPPLSGFSYDNTTRLGAATWRHVKFLEQPAPDGGVRWLFLSDVCKHCENAGCLQACPTGAIIRTEFDTVYVQQDVCNGCGYCVPACPFGVIALDFHGDGRAHKCTLCYDRLQSGLPPACAKACPTESIQFGPVAELRERARARLATLHARGLTEAYLYGLPGGPGATGGIGSLNAFHLLTAPPEAYGLPAAPRLPSRNALPGYLTSALAALALGAVSALAFALGRGGGRG